MAYTKFRAGAGSAEIVFPQEMFPTDRLYGVHDNPHVRILLFEGGEKAAIVAYELVNGDSFVNSSRELVSRLADIPYENVWVHVTHPITTPHTPGGPPAVPGVINSFGGAGGPGGKPQGGPRKDPEGPRKKALFLDSIHKALKAAIAAALNTMQDASYGVGTGECHVAVNRDVETPFGWWTGINPLGKTNKKMTILRVDGQNGKPIGFFMSYGVKPCAIDMSDMDKPTRLVSSDVPGVACRIMEKKFGVPCLFGMSAAGDQVPRDQVYVDCVDGEGKVGHMDLGVEKGFEVVEKLGREMGDVAVSIAESILCTADKADIAVARSNVMVELKAGASRLDAPVKEMEYRADGKTELDAGAIRLGDDFVFVAIRPETNCQTERELWESSPFENTVLISMVNGGMKYMPDKSAYELATWEAGSSMVMPGSAEKWVARAADMLSALKNDAPEPVITAVVEPKPDGARITKAIIEFSGSTPDPDALEVVDRTITKREIDGKTVTLYLSDDDKEAKVIPAFEFKPDGPGGPGGSGGPGGPGGLGGPGKPGGPRIAREKKLRPLAVEVMLPGIKTPVCSTEVSQPVIEDFTQGTYKRVLYNLFVPKGYDPAKKYPLVLFIPDASANGNRAVMALYQGIGATCWASPEVQEKNPCFVLAVEIPISVQLTDNDYTVSEEFNDIKELLDETVRKYSIDTGRLYATGQSQGCMASCELNIRYPELFAASMLLSGHWDIEKMTALTGKKFFFGLSEGGVGEFPNFNAITDGLEERGVKVSRVRLNFREGIDANDEKVRRAAESAQVVYAIFDKETAFPEGVTVPGIAHHSRGWELCFQLKSAINWILAQKL